MIANEDLRPARIAARWRCWQRTQLTIHWHALGALLDELAQQMTFSDLRAMCQAALPEIPWQHLSTALVSWRVALTNRQLFPAHD